jgi:hypothetical protein
MKKPEQHLIAEVPRRQAKVERTIGIDLGDVWSHYCTLNQDGEVADRGRFRTTPKAIEKWFTDVPPARVAMEAGTHSIWISEQLQELGHEVIVANVRELRAISHSDRKSDQVDAEKLARYARLDPNILRPIAHRTVAQQEALTLIRARALLVRLRTAAVNAARGLTKSCGYRMPSIVLLPFAIHPCQIDGALAVDEPHPLRHGVFRWNRDHPWNMVGKKVPFLNVKLFCSASLRNTSVFVPAKQLVTDALRFEDLKSKDAYRARAFQWNKPAQG